MIKTITNKLFLLVTMLLLSTVNALAGNVAKIGNVEYATLAEAIAAVPTDGTQTTIKMLADETLAEGATLTIATGKNIVLDLNGNTISGSSSVTNANFYFITNSGSLEITDNTANEAGKISYQAVKYDGGYSHEYVTIYNFRGTLTLTKGMVENRTGGGLAYAINNSSNAWGTASSTFNMDGGKISAPKGDAALRVYQNCSASSAYSKNYVNITGGTIVDTGIFIDEFLHKNNIPANYTGDNIETIINIYGGTINGLIDMKIRHPFNTELNIMDGTFTNTALRAYKYTDNSEYVEACGEPTEPLVYISGGNFTFQTGKAFGVAKDYGKTSWTNFEKPYEITGGTFNADPSTYLAENCEVAQEGNEWVVTEKSYPVMIGGGEEEGAYYATLEEAFAAVKHEQTISLRDNITLSKALDLTLAGKIVTLALDGHTLDGRVNLKSGELTVEGGTVINSNPDGQALNVYGSATAGAKDYSVLNVKCNVQDADFGVCMFGATASTNGYGAVVNILDEAYLNCTGEAAIFVSGNLGNNIEGNMNNVINIKSQVLGMAPSDDSPNNTVGVALHGNATVNVLAGATVSGNTGIAIKRGVLNVYEGANVAGEGKPDLNPDVNNNGVELTGAAISMTDTYNKYGSMAVNIYGGEITSTNSKALFKKDGNYANAATFAVSGGTFSSAVREEFCAEGYVPTALGNNQYGVKQAVPVAKIGDVEYTTLAKAFAAAQNGQTIKLIADCELTEVLTNTKNVTLDLGTFTIYGTIEDFMIQNKGTLEINADATNPGKIYNTVFAKRRGPVCNLAEGTITINGGIFGDNDADPTNVSTVNGGWGFFNLGIATINGGIFTTGDPDYNGNVWAYAINNGDDDNTPAHLTINGGKVYGKHGDIANDSGTMIINDVTTFGTAQYYNIYCERGDVTVNGGTFAKQVGKINLHVYADATATVTVKGGTFTKNTVDNMQFAGGNGTVALMGGTYNKQPEAKVVAAGYEAVDNNNGTWTVSPAAVAKIGETEYTTLEAAFATAEDGQTITLLANCSGNGIIVEENTFTTGLTVDFGGFTYTVNGTTLAGSTGTKNQAFQLKKGNKITFKNGAIVGSTADVKMLIQNYSDLTLSYMTLDATQGTNSVNYVLSTNNGNTVINHTTITAKTNGKAFDVDSGWGNYESNSVELMGESVINGDIEVAFEGKTDGTPSVLKLTVGTLNGKIVMGTGANQCTVIKGTNFVAAAPEGYEWKDNGNYTLILKAIEYINDVTDKNGETVVSKETATIANDEATITKVEIAQEGVKNVTVSAAINNANVTEIAVGAFKSLANTAVQTIDLSSTQVALSGERSKNPVLKDIPATALIYLPSSSSEVEGTNVVIKEAENKYTCNDFQMLDEQDYSVPTPFTATTATLTRSFTADLHCTVCLPYNVPKENINGKIYRYTAFKAATTTIEMTQDIDGLDANVPYIFVPNSGTGSISASNIEVKMENPQTTQGNFTFKGVFEEKRFNGAEYSAGIYGYAGENWQGLSQGAFYKLAQTAYVPAMRAYLVSNSVAGAPSINGAQAAQSLPTKIQVVLKNADGETTDILHFDMETAEDDTPVYNLNGQRVNNAEKGVYIKNGKKVIIK